MWIRSFGRGDVETCALSLLASLILIDAEVGDEVIYERFGRCSWSRSNVGGLMKLVKGAWKLGVCQQNWQVQPSRIIMRTFLKAPGCRYLPNKVLASR